MANNQLQNTMQKDLQSLILMAKTGYYPLFYKEWIDHSLSDNDYYKRINMVRAKKNLHATMKKLSKHKTIDRKKIALNQLPNKERITFIQSFFKVIEYSTLEKIKELH